MVTIVKKQYTWEEIKEVLIKKLKNTKHIMTFGTIGSCKVENDIDTIITKKPKSKTSDFYKEIHNLFDDLNNYLMGKYSGRVICFSQYEIESLKLANYSGNDLAFQVMAYTSYPQIERDWEWFLLETESLEEILDSYDCLIGNKKDLSSKDFQKARDNDVMYVLFYLYDKINSQYDEEFLVEVMNDHFNLFFNKKLKMKVLAAKDKKQVKEIFYKLCDIVDKLEENRK